MSCYPTHWEAVVRAFDGGSSKRKRVQLKIVDLDAVLACTPRREPEGLVLDRRREYVIVDRDHLLALIQEHGAEPCRAS